MLPTPDSHQAMPPARSAPVTSPSEPPIVCNVLGCQQVFVDKKQRKEHTFQYHSIPKVAFRNQSEPLVVPRALDGFLHCPCLRYRVQTVGALKRHAKKCSGQPEFDTQTERKLTNFENKCTQGDCDRSFKTRNALAVHVYEYHSSPRVLFFGKESPTIIQRDEHRYLRCPCGSYSVLTVGAILKHAKTCTGNAQDRPESFHKSPPQYWPSNAGASSSMTFDCRLNATPPPPLPMQNTQHYYSAIVGKMKNSNNCHFVNLSQFETTPSLDMRQVPPDRLLYELLDLEF
ncbi:hypothetical protein BJ741DRAFT_649707 [Chytriomyces cf. hyalinus JEL632]|nr:hypothetical protein BJ741DRAFT_649707 [Chytriomyces cf. hyalinus JEL632]